MTAQVVHHPVDGLRIRVLASQVSHDLGELGSGTIRGHEGEVPAGFRFYRAEDCHERGRRDEAMRANGEPPLGDLTKALSF